MKFSEVLLRYLETREAIEFEESKSTPGKRALIDLNNELEYWCDELDQLVKVPE